MSKKERVPPIIHTNTAQNEDGKNILHLFREIERERERERGKHRSLVLLAMKRNYMSRAV